MTELATQPASALPASDQAMGGRLRTAAIAWVVTAVYFFYQYALRSAPSVMMPQLSEGFGLSALSVASILGLFYYGYSPFSLVAGAAMDGLGPQKGRHGIRDEARERRRSYQLLPLRSAPEHYCSRRGVAQQPALAGSSREPGAPLLQWEQSTLQRSTSRPLGLPP